ncbi:MAG: hypothetical protein LH629_03555 [Ignavibacteria bacterium]|nr:hypothetical protein [Ignavibacteria bacterium]
MKHTHILKNAPEKDKTYRVEYKGSELYDAKVLAYDGGCWAKIRIENVIPSENDNLYKEGQEFDLKLAYYKLAEVTESEIIEIVEIENDTNK